MQIEYVRGCENAIADALSRLDSVSIDAEVPAKLARGVPSYACPVAEVDFLDARTDWIAQQSADPTIARVIHLLNANARADVDELEENPALKAFADAWPQLVIEDALLKHCNEHAVSTRIVVPAILREEVFRALHESAHHGYEATLRPLHNASGGRASAVTSLHSRRLAKCAIVIATPTRFRARRSTICQPTSPSARSTSTL